MTNGYNGFPFFNAPDILAKNLKDVGFDALTTANNHSIDQKIAGINNTLDILDSAGISHTGTARTQEERDSILIIEKNRNKGRNACLHIWNKRQSHP